MKKKIAMILTLLVFTASCDSPRSQRAFNLSGNNSNGLSGNVNIPTTNLDNSGSTSSANTITNTDPNEQKDPIIPTDAKHCKFSSDGLNGFESPSVHLGEYTLCQSSSDKNIVYFQLKTPPINTSGDVSVCLIPTTSSGANSIYVGNPMCGYFKNPKAIRKINFIKYPQYANATINGVMLFKDLSWYYPVYNNYMTTLDAYKTCMNMLAYGNTAYCQSFKTVGQYIFKQF